MGEPLRLLLVEDSEDDALLLLRELRRGGYDFAYRRVETEEAFRTALTEPWDIVIVDYVLPRFSGMRALAVLREQGRDLPVIMVSGKQGEETAVEVMRAGAHDYILKGNLARLNPAVARELREAEVRRQRRQAEEALLSSEERYRTFFDLEPDALFLIDGESLRFLDANQAAEQLYGYTHEEFLTLTPRAISAEPEQTIASITGTRVGETVRIPFRLHKRRDGAVFPVEITDTAFLLGDRRVVIAAIRDITERLEAEEALRESEERFRRIVDTAGEGIWVLDNTGTTTYVNQQLADMLGYTREEILDRSLLDFVHPAEVDDVRQRLQSGAIERVHGEGHFRRKDGTDLWVLIAATPLLDRDGALTGSLGMLTDITERKRAEEALEQERAFVTSAIDLLPFPIVFNTPAGRILRANEASYRFFGPLASEQWWTSTLLTADTRRKIPPEDWPMIRSARGEVVPATEALFILPDGREVPVLAYSAPVFVGEMLVATVVAFQDITALKEADRAKDRFLSVLSHELRTPLSNILGWVKEAQEAPEIIPQALGIIRRNAESQHRMLENVLEVSRLLHGRLTLRREPSDLWALTEEVADGMAHTAEGRQILLQRRAPEMPLPVAVDRKRIQLVIADLLDNALKYTGAKGTVTVSGARLGDAAVLTVQDTGRGIPPERLPHLFELFNIPDEMDATEGLRISLGISQQIVEAHDGQLTADSPGPGHGSLFTLTLPIAHPEADDQ